MSLGLAVMAVGAILFIPAAQGRNYPLFLVGLFIIGTGLTILQTASNPYAAIIGPIESAASRISILGICNKVAGILAGLIFGSIALKDADKLLEQMKTMDPAARNATLQDLSQRVVNPYIIISIVLVLLAVAVYFSSLPEIKDDAEVTDSEGNVVEDRSGILRYPHLLLGVLAIFVYVGVEVMAGDTIISYGKSLGIPLATARYFTQGTLGCMLAGYLLGIALIPKFISQQKALRIAAILGTLFVIVAVCGSTYVSIVFIALLGFANAIMWPAIWPLAITGLGRHTKMGSALLVMGIAGGAILPPLYGKLSEIVSIGSQKAYLIMVPCYLYILYYSVTGYRAGLDKKR